MAFRCRVPLVGGLVGGRAGGCRFSVHSCLGWLASVGRHSFCIPPVDCGPDWGSSQMDCLLVRHSHCGRRRYCVASCVFAGNLLPGQSIVVVVVAFASLVLVAVGREWWPVGFSAGTLVPVA